MNTLKPTLVLLFVLLLTNLSFSQTTIWEEDFSTYADETIVGTANRWTLATTAGINLLPGSNNHFWTVSNALEARNTLGLEQVFTTESIDISAYSNISISVDVFEQGNNTNTDYVDVYYILDGGTETLFSTNGQNNANYTSQIAQQTGLNGSTLQIVIRASNNANGKRHSFDNIAVRGVAGITPGAVETGLQLWMRADEGISAGDDVDNTEVDSWTDQSNNGYVGNKEANGPLYIEEGINFNPVLRFNRSDNTYFNLGQAANLDIKVGPTTLGRSDITVFAAFLTDQSGAGTILSKGNNNVRSYQLWLGDIDRVVHYTWGRDQTGSPSYDSRNWGDIHGRNEPKITTGTVNVSGYRSYVNNIEDNMVFDLGVGEGAATQDVMIGARRSGDGPNNTGSGNVLSGDVAEIIVYNRELNTTEIQKVNSYLAIKYGITLGYNDETFVLGNSPETQGITYSGASSDYIASDGSTLWNGAANSGFGYNVFGIARDDNSNLMQLKSKSSNVQRIEVSPGNANFLDAILTLEDEDGTLDNDLSYLLVGHNGQDIALHTSSLPERSESLLNRVWRSRESNTDTGKTTLTFDLNQYVGTTITNPEDLVLFVADNSAFTGYCNYVGTIAGNVLTFTGVNLEESTYFTLGVPTSLNGDLDIEFDGSQSYISSDRMLGGKSEATIMAWIKPSNSFNFLGTIAGEESFCISLNGNDVPRVDVVTNTGTSVTRDANAADALTKNQWTHIAAIYNAADSSVRLYINGEESIADPNNIPDVSGASLSTTIGTANSTFAIGKDGAEFGTQFFDGDIDEVRVLDVALTEDQMRKMIFQEITQNGGNIRGTIIPKDINDVTSGSTVAWSNLLAYYPMSSVKGNVVFDESNNAVQAKLNNVGNVIKAQTAPIPYETTVAGTWDTESTWLHGDVWDIENIAAISDWGIVQIKHDVSTSERHKTVGLFIDSGVTLNVNGENEINNSWYLELNGTLDLQADSQLIQGSDSDLVTSATGAILRRQEGNINSFWYNYWSSPVGTVGTTNLSNNNTSSNNTNNTTFNISMLQDGDGNNMTFTSNFEDSGMISDRWLYSFQNGLTYWDWTTLTPASPIAPGVGYTQKGTGAASVQQQYIFEGKPNNGTILIAADDVDADSGNESQQNVTMTTTMVGNPYPSALDARQFIADNAGVIQGTILLWEQWAGSSHWLAEYEGGYGYINSMTTERAYQHPDIPIASQTQTQGIKTPSFYIPVAQGFFVEVIEDGNIEFNNGQRVFIKESDALDTDPESGSVFFREANNIDASVENEDPFQLIRLEFNTSAGASRRFVLGFSENATDGFDYGLDGGYINEMPNEDMGSLFEGKQFVLQAFAPITEDKEIDLNLNVSGDLNYSIGAVELSNIAEDQELYLRDNLTDTYYNLRDEQPYQFTSEAGQFSDRFDVVFKAPQTLNNDVFETNNVRIYMNNLEDKLFVKGFDQNAKSLVLTNMLGQTVRTMLDISNNTLKNGVSIQNLSSGIYVVSIKAEDNTQISKKIILE